VATPSHSAPARDGVPRLTKLLSRARSGRASGAHPDLAPLCSFSGSGAGHGAGHAVPDTLRGAFPAGSQMGHEVGIEVGIWPFTCVLSEITRCGRHIPIPAVPPIGRPSHSTRRQLSAQSNGHRLGRAVSGDRCRAVTATSAASGGIRIHHIGCSADFTLSPN
jgi:hypothetical protein